MYSIFKRLASHRILFSTLVIVLLGLSACDQEWIDQLPPEQRALFYRMTGQEEPDADAESLPDSESLTRDEAVSREPFTLERLAEDDHCSRLRDGTPRGLACLHCSQEEARVQAKLISTLLFRSCLKNIAINYLVDGSFSFDAEFLMENIALMTSNERRLFVHFYITNGSSQRRWSTTPVHGFGTTISPEEFRQRIQNDPVFQAEYQQLITRLVPVLRFARSRGAVLSIAPALEDNLSNRAFEAMLQLTEDAIPADLPVAIVRNACPGCYAGNGNEVPAGVLEEVHTTSPFFDTKDGIVTNDGVSYFFPQSEEDFAIDSSSELALEDLAPVRDAAEATNSAFILWKSEWQGLPQSPNTASRFAAPSERNYEMPSLDLRRKVILFLRAGRG